MSRIEQAREFISQGDKIKARAILASLVQSEPRNADAWLLLATVLDDAKQAAYCRERAQSILQTTSKPEMENVQRPMPQGQPAKKCPHCAGELPIDAIVCHHCDRVVSIDFKMPGPVKPSYLPLAQNPLDGYISPKQNAEKPPLKITQKASLFWALSLVGGFLICAALFGVFLSSYIQPISSEPLTPTPRAARQDLRIGTITACISWDEVTPQMAGSKVCVCDVIKHDKQDEQTGQTFYYFGRTSQFYLSLDRLEISLKGECICASGVVQLDSYNTPYIEIKDNIGACP
ncbi:MAG: hypothetical protein HY865_06270 [Chloroflexi bacterium]|nr:hypothetical protein [Chloroflexota bacterium]